jgi:GxxExxY protein
MQDKIIHREPSYQIMKAVFEVHNTLGPGYLEKVYEEALAVELELLNIPFERQKEITVIYKVRHVGQHRLDFVIDGRIVLELKSVSTLANVHKKQVLSYVKATDLRLGILVNFATLRVQSERIAN